MTNQSAPRELTLDENNRCYQVAFEKGATTIMERVQTAMREGITIGRAESASDAPEGWQLVPKEPTGMMSEEGGSAVHGIEWEDADVIYRAMLAAAPAPETPRTTATPCTTCGQTDVGQHGEYPCATCGLPRTWGNAPETPRTTDEAVACVYCNGNGTIPNSYADRQFGMGESHKCPRCLGAGTHAPRTMAAQPAVDAETHLRAIVNANEADEATWTHRDGEHLREALEAGRAFLLAHDASSPAAPVAQADAQACPTCGCVNTYAGHWPFPKCAAIAAQADGSAS